MPREELVKYFWYLFGVMGVVFFWVGLWDGLGNLGPLKNPWISLALGVAMLIVSKLIFKETDPAQLHQQEAKKALQEVHTHPQRHEFQIKYPDKIKQKHVFHPVQNLHKIEKGFLVFLQEGREIFVPIHRIAEIHRQGQLYKTLQPATPQKGSEQP